ncbi:MAG: metallophosphoesterase, partial [Anaerolineales bacterium]|nr:metallophosphoesterase [Anaerolineales bacterium]
RIPTFMGEFWGPLEITTLSEAIFPLTIGVFGDSGFGETLTRDLAAQLSSYAPDFIIHTGDLVYRADEQGGPEAAYQLKWYQTLSSLLAKTVIYPVVGNHEYDPDAILKGIPYYFSAFPMLDELQGGWQEAPAGAERQWYALEFGSLQMVFLNTQQLYGGAAREQQDVWLKSRLADPGFTATIVVFHVPPFTSGLHNLDGQAVISRWVSEFEASNVVLVLSGHDHNYERLERNGITYLVSGGGSSVLYPLQQRREESLRFDLKSHFVYLEVSAEELQIKVFDVEGTLFDSETIALHP